ncbi:copine-9 isoform X3 [Homo sapiens]|uniref:copine-9 isoform X3 n=1 Tax=Homo sapiens TaxID=9606 RepID=UPI0005D01D3C|nr:copine-9 isoform X3 [Homo sapiens]XP_054201320.1 copine-9 isoform X3 [Homo sapiens]|eukprot:XP_011531691.1 copine-9 isoform X3 [Homo sapiens]
MTGRVAGGIEKRGVLGSPTPKKGLSLRVQGVGRRYPVGARPQEDKVLGRALFPGPLETVWVRSRPVRRAMVPGQRFPVLSRVLTERTPAGGSHGGQRFDAGPMPLLSARLRADSRRADSRMIHSVCLLLFSRNLLDLDTFSKSDPMVVLYTQSRASQEWREFGRTEVIDNTLNPDFVRKFVLDYFFEEKQNLRFDVYNVDSKTNISKPKDFLGQAFLALGEVIGGQGSRVERTLTGVPGKKCGTILLTAEELSNCRDIATMQLCANKLDKKDFFGKSDPFLVFYRSNEDGTFTICHKTEVVKNTLNPVWQPFSIPVRALCNGDYDRTVKIDVYDWDRDGSHDFIGEFTTSYRELSKAQNQFTVYEVLNPRKKCKKKKYVNSGTVTLLSFSVDSEFTFVDYIKGGTQLNFTVAIDFTASNEQQ